MDDLVGDERNFLHKLTNALAIAHGSIHAAKSMYERDGEKFDQATFEKRLTSACNAVDEMVHILEVRRTHLESLYADS